jgi:N-acetylmuramoyl-L-alanine amidase
MNKLTLLIISFFILVVTAVSVKAESEIDCLAIAILKEAGNQPRIGRDAVGLVILNRAEQRDMSICQVIKERKQFSWYKGGSIKKYVRKKDTRIVALRLEAHDLIDDPSNSKAYRRVSLRNATYFHATYVRPKWARSMCKPTRVKDHVFYSECIA